ncbi:MAG: SpoIIE family protein phosphatase [Bacteroidales bacterium]|nr:SpoIIE family protein phosphatase [Bacteroidales bacterium]
MSILSKLEKRRIALQGFMVVIAATVALEATSIVQYYYSRKGIQQEATRRAEGQLEATSLQITNVMDQVETAVRNNLWGIRLQLGRPDSLWTVTQRLVNENPVIVGSAVALKENYYRSKGKYFSPYSYKDGDEILSKQLGNEKYDYFSMEWYVKPLETKGGYWSEPYFDEGGGNMLMTTYSLPITDAKGRVVGVVTADISLDWLTELVGNVKVYPNAYSMMISRQGQIMVCPAETLVMRHNVMELSAQMEDSAAYNSINRRMMAGEKGNVPIKYNKEIQHVFFAPVERTGWSMSIVIPDDAIYGDIKKLGLLIKILQIFGILMLILILNGTIKNQMKLRHVSENKSRIENELKIASAIQMAMLPKTFPPFPERHDLDIYASIYPAKEVGGDLYDFFIKEEKLFFCIGDVSGKGVPASLVMAVTRSLFRTIACHEKSPLRIVTAMNESMSDGNESNMFVTLFVGVLDLGSGLLKYCNAGHNAPLLLKEGKAQELAVKPNLPLGIMASMDFEEQEARLAKGDRLFLYTDGITEAENASHELFGENRLLGTLSKASDLSATQQINKVGYTIGDFVAGAPQSDDQTMLDIIYFGNPESEGTERHLVLHNDIQQIPQLAEFVETIADEAGIDQSLAMSLNLALEEAVSNVILYAYPEGSDGLVDIEAIIRKDRLDFCITDSGKPFDPTKKEDADITLGVEERQIGGLGIYLVRNIMDSLSYERKDDKNILSMTKKL